MTLRVGTSKDPNSWNSSDQKDGKGYRTRSDSYSQMGCAWFSTASGAICGTVYISLMVSSRSRINLFRASAFCNGFVTALADFNMSKTGPVEQQACFLMCWPRYPR